MYESYSPMKMNTLTLFSTQFVLIRYSLIPFSLKTTNPPAVAIHLLPFLSIAMELTV